MKHGTITNELRTDPVTGMQRIKVTHADEEVSVSGPMVLALAGNKRVILDFSDDYGFHGHYRLTGYDREADLYLAEREDDARTGSEEV